MVEQPHTMSNWDVRHFSVMMHRVLEDNMLRTRYKESGQMKNQQARLTINSPSTKPKEQENVENVEERNSAGEDAGRR